MINYFNKIITEGVQNKDLNYFGKHVEALSEQYGVSEKTVYNRFKSCFGVSPKELIKSKLYPTKEEFNSIILNSSSSKEVFYKLKLPTSMLVGIYDKYYKVSTFQKARLKVLNSKVKVQYSNLREDNRSIIYSQLLGDGSYNKSRHGLRIIHGEKQIEYLKWKVSLLNLAYPKTNSTINIKVHKQGHIYGDYYTKLGNVDIPNEVNCVEKLTNLGWLLWFLDDGSYTQNICIACSRSEEIRAKAIQVLKTFGITARQDSTSIIMVGQENDLLFYKNFIEPFKHNIPNCMLYKVEDIVEKLII